MRVIDPGHVYALKHLDGPGEEMLTFVKREGPGYPGNTGPHAGTNIQETLRVVIDRMKYVDRQIPHRITEDVLDHLRESIRLLEERAAERHGRSLETFAYNNRTISTIEEMGFCLKCGHIGCLGCCGK